MMTFRPFKILLLVVTTPISVVFAVEPSELVDVRPPGPNRSDEPMAAKFSWTQAARFLDAASLDWQATRKCMTCHTNYAYLYARPSIGSQPAAHREVRRYAEQLVLERWPDKGPRWDTEVVATAAALAFNDAATSGVLHEATRQALDRMWTVQREDGGWTWLNCDWPPLESDDHYGVTLAAIAAGVAPGDYARTEAAAAGLARLKKYLRNNPASTLHHRAMLVWAASYLNDLISDAERRATVEELIALQKQDGGWALATLGDWQRADGEAQDTATSDGYGTGFVVFVLRQAGEPVDSTAIRRGIEWLKTHQRASGRWFTRSLHRDNKHFISHAGTAMAVMALGACGEPQVVSGEDR